MVGTCGNLPHMNDRLDPLVEPMRCAHGALFVGLGDDVEWINTCRPCALDLTVAETSGVAA